MLLIEHRVNTVEKLRTVPHAWGVEIDVRDYDGALRCTHDPFSSGDILEELLSNFCHQLVIFNVKCDGLEQRIEELAVQHKIQNYFFLDVAAPTLVQMTHRGQSRAAVRFSEYEPIEGALAFRGKTEWIWVDCFNRLPLTTECYERLKKYFKICLVSPELQKHPRSWIQDFRRQLNGLQIDAVCSDYCADWL